MESAAIGASLRFDAHGSYVLFATAASLAYTGPGSQPARGSNVVRFRSDPAWPLALCRADHPAVLLEPVHDTGVVRPSQIQGGVARDRGAGELGHRLAEYCFAAPANRIGSAVYSPAEL